MWERHLVQLMSGVLTQVESRTYAAAQVILDAGAYNQLQNYQPDVDSPVEAA